jgi:hypothetical protein
MYTTSDKMYGLAQIDDPELPGRLALQIKSRFGQILSFRIKLDPRSDNTMAYYVTVNLYAKHEEFPSDVVRVMSLSMVPESQSMIQTNTVKEYHVLTLCSVGNVHHSTRFSWRKMPGQLNTFGPRCRIECATKALS